MCTSIHLTSSLSHEQLLLRWFLPLPSECTYLWHFPSSLPEYTTPTRLHSLLFKLILFHVIHHILLNDVICECKSLYVYQILHRVFQYLPSPLHLSQRSSSLRSDIRFTSVQVSLTFFLKAFLNFMKVHYELLPFHQGNSFLPILTPNIRNSLTLILDAFTRLSVPWWSQFPHIDFSIGRVHSIVGEQVLPLHYFIQVSVIRIVRVWNFLRFVKHLEVVLSNFSLSWDIGRHLCWIIYVYRRSSLLCGLLFCFLLLSISILYHLVPNLLYFIQMVL